jgi:hypothetical protein
MKLWFKARGISCIAEELLALKSDSAAWSRQLKTNVLYVQDVQLKSGPLTKP